MKSFKYKKKTVVKESKVTAATTTMTTTTMTSTTTSMTIASSPIENYIWELNNDPKQLYFRASIQSLSWIQKNVCYPSKEKSSLVVDTRIRMEMDYYLFLAHFLTFHFVGAHPINSCKLVNSLFGLCDSYYVSCPLCIISSQCQFGSGIP